MLRLARLANRVLTCCYVQFAYVNPPYMFACATNICFLHSSSPVSSHIGPFCQLLTINNAQGLHIFHGKDISRFSHILHFILVHLFLSSALTTISHFSCVLTLNPSLIGLLPWKLALDYALNVIVLVPRRKS